MATAVETQPQSGKVAAPALGLLPASIAGAALFVASFVLVGYGVARLTADLAPAAAGVLACRVIGSNGPRGSVGGAFLTFVCLAVTFVLGRAVGLWMEGTGFVGQ